MKYNFGDLPDEYSSDNSRIVILPVPYDGTSTWIKGADKGPNAILEASANMEVYDIETESEIYRLGIMTDKPVLEKKSPESMSKAVYERAIAHIRKGKFLVTLGGEHSVSIGAIKAHAEMYKGVSVLQFDAHSDTREAYHGSGHNHACVMARARELCPIMQVGIRSMSGDEKIDKDRVLFAHQFQTNSRWMDNVVSKLTGKVYVTIDLDVFDSSIMPSTGTPEPGGLGWYQVVGMLKQLSAEKEVVGFDVVELCPNKANKAPDFLAAKLVYTFLSYRFSGELGK